MSVYTSYTLLARSAVPLAACVCVHELYSTSPLGCATSRLCVYMSYTLLARSAVPLAACVSLHVTGVRCTDDIAAVNPRLRVIRDK